MLNLTFLFYRKGIKIDLNLKQPPLFCFSAKIQDHFINFLVPQAVTTGLNLDPFHYSHLHNPQYLAAYPYALDCMPFFKAGRWHDALYPPIEYPAPLQQFQATDSCFKTIVFEHHNKEYYAIMPKINYPFLSSSR